MESLRFFASFKKASPNVRKETQSQKVKKIMSDVDIDNGTLTNEQNEKTKDKSNEQNMTINSAMEDIQSSSVDKLAEMAVAQSSCMARKHSSEQTNKAAHASPLRVPNIDLFSKENIEIDAVKSKKNEKEEQIRDQTKEKKDFSTPKVNKGPQSSISSGVQSSSSSPKAAEKATAQPVYVSNIPIASWEIVHIYLESPKKGGSIKTFEYNAEGGWAKIIFEDSEGNKNPHYFKCSF